MNIAGMKVVARLPAGTKTMRFLDLLVFVHPDLPVRYFDMSDPKAGVKILDSELGSKLGDLVVYPVNFDQL